MTNVYFRPTVAQARFFNLSVHQQKKQVLFCGGIGSAKTSTLAIELVRFANTYHKPCLIMSPTFATMRDSTLAAFTRMYEKLQVHHKIVGQYLELGTYPPGSVNAGQPIRHYLRTYQGEREGESKLAGMQPAAALLDEFSQASQKIWDEVIGRMREPETSRQVLCASTPGGMNHMYDIFEADKTKYKDRATVYCNTEGNSINLPADYIENLRFSYTDQVAAERLDGKYVEYTGAVFKNMRFVDYKPDPDLPFSISIDFGVQHPAAWFFQKQKVTDIHGNQRAREVIFDYVQEENLQTMELCQRIKQRLELHGLKSRPAAITCDPTGNNRASRSRVSDVAQVDQFFNIQSLYSWAPRLRSIVSGINIINCALNTGNLVISKSCEFHRKGQYSCPGESFRAAIFKRDGSGEYEKGGIGKESDHGIDACHYYFINVYSDFIVGERFFKEVEC
jgi:hypothetical protein